MRIVVQRSLESSVIVDKKTVGKIKKGLVLLVGFTLNDTVEDIDYMIKKFLNLRIFNDELGKMNKSVLDIKGEILSISQFTLYGDTKKGNRPSFITALSYDEASKLYDLFNDRLSEYIKVEKGIFGGDMRLNITNDGPVTILIESRYSNDKE